MWLLWAITVIIYSEVILGLFFSHLIFSSPTAKANPKLFIYFKDDTSSSPCEGRVEKSYDDEEENTRTLAIVSPSFLKQTDT